MRVEEKERVSGGKGWMRRVEEREKELVEVEKSRREKEKELVEAEMRRERERDCRICESNTKREFKRDVCVREKEKGA